MSRQSRSHSPSPRPSKRARIDPSGRRYMTSDDFKNGVFLAPMVRSGALPTRLSALKYGATLVWGPETVDKAILHCDREIDPTTGVVSYNGKTRAVFATHPVEKPYLIYQIGTADPELAVKAALKVLPDVSGIDLNCGCPKSFSTQAGMGAALLTNPDLLCSILMALRAALPKEVSVSAKIRLLPDQGDTLKLVERIAKCGVAAITVHCRTRNMRPREKALIERLREVVEFIDGLGLGVAVVENGDCVGWEDAKRIRKITGAHSVMVATAAEANPSVFSQTPLIDVERTFVPSYLRLSHYLGNHFSLTKFCVKQFKSPRQLVTRTDRQGLHDVLDRAKSWEGWEELAGGWDEDWRELDEIKKVLEKREEEERTIPMLWVSTREDYCVGVSMEEDSDGEETETEMEPAMNPFVTPVGSLRAIPPTPGAPLEPSNWGLMVPSGVSLRTEETPSPCGVKSL